MSTTKAQLEDILSIYRAEIKTLKDLIKDLREDRRTFTSQIERLQDALIAVSSPEAYQDQRMDRLEEPDRISDEEKNKTKEIQKIEQEWIRRLEDDTFTNAEDLTDKLGRILMIQGTEPPDSLHGNDES